MRRSFQYTVILAIFCGSAIAQTATVTTFYQFNGTDGGGPQGPPVEAADGNIYGVTTEGGTNNAGVAYRISLSGDGYTALGSFTTSPQNTIVAARDGNFYGYFQTGVYRVTPQGVVTNLDSQVITQNIIPGVDGNLYFVSSDIYQIVLATGAVNDYIADPGGALSIENIVETSDGSLWSYGNTTDGDSCIIQDGGGGFYCFPSPEYGEEFAAMIVGPDGQLYGTAGDSATVYFFKYNTSTEVLTTLHTFATDEQVPTSYLLASDGNFYGIGNEPILIRMTPSGEYSELGSVPVGGSEVPLVQLSDGSLLGAGGGGDYGGLSKIVLDPPLSPPILLSLGSTSLIQGNNTTLSWSVSGMYGGSAGYCFATSNDPEWSGTKPLSGQITLTPTAVGGYQYALTCGGTTSGLTSLTVTSNGKVNTSTSVQVSPNPVTIGSNAALTATVTPSSGTTMPGGTVTFLSGSTTIGSAALNSSGTATLSANTIGLAPGTYTVTAKYNGSSGFNPSTSATTQITVTSKIVSSVTLTATPAGVVEGNKVTLNATVSPTQGNGVPTGTVKLSTGSQIIAALTLSSGSASVTASTAGITPGSYTVTAAYSGSAGYQPSSTTTTVTVEWPTTTTLSVQPNPVVQGGTLTLVATVARTGNSNEPTGTVQFKVGSNVVGSASVAGGTASLSIPTGAISQGTYGVTAAYSGDADDGASNSALVDVKID